MNHLRAVLGIVGGAALGYLIAVCIAGIASPRDVGVSIAVIAFCVLGIGLVRAVQADQRAADKAYHPSTWRLP